MAFRHLEDSVQESQENTDAYLSLFGDLKEPTRTVLAYTLDLATYLKSVGLQEDYMVFGGYAVLSHLMKTHGEGFAKLWRGSSDIDMAGTLNVLHAVKRGYSASSDFPSPNVTDKRTIKLTEDKEKECKIDFYLGDRQALDERFDKPEVNVHLGIPLNVVSPLRLIKGKLQTPAEQPEHAIDVMSMLGVLQGRGHTPQEIIQYFDVADRPGFLARVIHGRDIISSHRIGASPTGDFEGELIGLLKKLTQP